MNETQSVKMDLKVFEQKFMDDVNRILESQQEIEKIREQLKNAMNDAKQLPGKVVQFEKLMALKEISELLEVKEDNNERMVKDLHSLVFPGNIFVAQEFFDFAVVIQQDKVVKFGDYLNSIDVVNSSELE